MRVFISVDLPENAKKEISKAIKKIKDMDLINANFVKPENLHLTLKFLGEISESEIEKIKEKLSSLNLKSFIAKLCGLGFFPSEKFLRVFLISIEAKEKFSELSEKINSLLGNRKERFESHVTLARIKSITDKIKFLEVVKNIRIPELKFEVKETKLKKSTLSPSGPIYEDIEVFSLI